MQLNNLAMNFLFQCPIILLLISCSINLKQSVYFEQLPDNFTPEDVQIFADSIYNRAHEVIPLLINDIVRDEKILIGLGNPYSSNLASEYWNKSYRGVRSAYLIEFLLGAKKNYELIQQFREQNGLPVSKSNDDTWQNKTGFYFLRHSNIIL